MLQKLADLFTQLITPQPLLVKGHVLDIGTGLDLPARDGLAVSIRPDYQLGGASLGVACGYIPGGARWRIAVQEENRPAVEVSIDGNQLQNLMENLQTQVSHSRQVTNVPLPQLEAWK